MRSQDEQLLRLPPVWSKLSLLLFPEHIHTLQSILCGGLREVEALILNVVREFPGMNDCHDSGLVDPARVTS